ncbi:MAG: MotA/TolQ/ExbB proton channel family protein [Clostridiales Family XIII bacterium]|jgi:flagellar motor component MotA|nr:MotA/TolQ/ExbB proton channel family protein [Clostridiales Family XIII bacterium]
MYLTGIAAFLLSFLLVFALKGVNLTAFLNPAALFAVLFLVISTLIATSNFKLFLRGVNAVLSRKYFLPEADRQKAAELFRLLSKVSIIAGVFGILVGAIAMLGNMSDMEAMGHALVAALIAPLNGIIAALAIFEPAAFILRNRDETDVVSKAVKVYPKALGDKLLELCYQSGLSAEEIEKATEIELR